MHTIILVILAGIFNSIMDTLQFHYSESIFKSDKFKLKFWYPNISWKNKYKDLNPDKGPKFFGSTTFLVAFTDAWHLFKLLFLFLLFFTIVTYHPIINYYPPFNIIFDFILLRALFGATFEGIFRLLKRK